MVEQGEQREIWTSAPEENADGRWRKPVIASGVSALVAVVVCGGGLALANRAGDSGPTAPAAAMSPLPIPMIMSADDLEVDPQDLPGSLEKATARLAEAVRAGEKVYSAARPTAPPRALERLRTALDEASAVLEDKLGPDATRKQQTERLGRLEELHAKILDAAARITAVRTVPGGELPPGTTTAAVAPDDLVPYGEDDGAGETAGGDSVRADGGTAPGSGSGGSDSGGSGSGGSSGSGSGGSGSGSGSGGSGSGGSGGSGGPGGTPTPSPTRTATPTPSPAPSSPAPSPTPSGSAPAPSPTSSV